MSYILLLFLVFAFDPSEPREDSRQNSSEVLEEQLYSYMHEYENSRSSQSLWLIYHVIAFSAERYHVLNRVVEQNRSEFTAYAEITSCIDENADNPERNYLDHFVLCAGDPNLTISHLHELKDNGEWDENQFVSRFTEILDESLLDEKHTLHLDYLFERGNGFNNYENTLVADQIDILDFYYFNIVEIDSISDHTKAITENWADSLRTRRDTGSTSFVSDYLVTINALYRNRESELLIHNLSQLINDYHDLPISELTMRIFNYLSYSSYLSGYYQHDIEMHRSIVLPLAEYFSHETQMQAHLDYGVSLYSLGSTQASLNTLQYVYDNITEFSDLRYQSALLNNLGIVYLQTGMFDKYIQLQIEALNFAENNNLLQDQVHFLLNLYTYHRRIQNWSTSNHYLEEIREISESQNDKENIARVELNFGLYYRDFKNDYDRALEHLQKAYEIRKELNEFSLLNISIGEFTRTYELMEQYDKAREFEYKRVELARERNNSLYELIGYIQIARQYFLSDLPEKAEPYIEKISSMDKIPPRFQIEVDRVTVLTKNSRYHNRTEEKMPLLREYANEILSRMHNSADLQAGHLFLEREYLLLFKLLVDLLIEQNQIEEAFYWMDEIKNLSASSFYQNPALKSSILSESELIMDFALRNRIERLRREIRTAEDQRRTQLNNQLLESISELNVLQRKVLRNIDFQPADLGSLRKQLKRSDAILYFSVFENDLFAATITSGSYDIRKIAFSRQERERFDEIVENLSSDRIRLTELQWVREKVLDQMNLSDHLTNYYIIPDGFLYHIPFEILPTGEVSGDYSYGEASYLIEHASVSYVNSLKDLERSFDHNNSKSYELDFLGFGISHFGNSESQLLPGQSLPPLPLAEEEVTTIVSNLDKLPNRSSFLSSTGTDREFHRSAGSSRILHFASHSEVFDSDPLYSILHLNPVESQSPEMQESDGLIYAYELFEMDLSNEMVMLNSCESGSGNYIQGSGIVGFSRAFNYAGVQSLVLNLWTIRDRSAYELSVSFYSYLNEGMSKSEAMRQSKIDYINTRNSNPSYWGSFVVYGNTDPVVRPLNTILAGVLLFLLGIFSLIAGWYRYYGFSFMRGS